MTIAQRNAVLQPVIVCIFKTITANNFLNRLDSTHATNILPPLRHSWPSASFSRRFRKRYPRHSDHSQDTVKPAHLRLWWNVQDQTLGFILSQTNPFHTIVDFKAYVQVSLTTTSTFPTRPLPLFHEKSFANIYRFSRSCYVPRQSHSINVSSGVYHHAGIECLNL